MRSLHPFCLALIGTIQLPSASAQVGPPAPAHPAIHRDGSACWVEAASDLASGTRAAVGQSLGGGLWLRVSDPRWRFGPDHVFMVRVRDARHPESAVGPEAEAIEMAAAFRDIRGETGIQIQGSGVTRLLGTAPRLTVFDRDRIEPLATIDNPYLQASAALRACHDELAKGSGRPAVVPPAPIRPINTFLTLDDYPSAALRSGDAGRTAMHLSISADGRIAACKVTRSSGSPLLDSTSCQLLVRRARFAPALDADGKPTSGSFDTAINWQIEQD